MQLAVLLVLLWLCAAVRHHWARCRNSVRKPGGHSRMAWTEGGHEMHTPRLTNPVSRMLMRLGVAV